MFRMPTDLAPRRLTRDSPQANRSTIRTWMNGAAAAAVVLVASAPPSAAETYPSRTITIVVPFAAGGPSDVAGRILAQGLTDEQIADMVAYLQALK